MTRSSQHDFQQTLHALKTAAREPSPRAAPRPCADLAFLEARERLCRLLEAYLDDLVAELPDLRRRRRFHDGAWLEGVAADLPRPPARLAPHRGRRRPACTRLDFLLRILEGGHRVSLECRATVADVELETFGTEADAGGDLSELRGVIESACLAFAQRMFEQGRAP